MEDKIIKSCYQWCLNKSLDIKKDKDKMIMFSNIIKRNLNDESYPLILMNKVKCLNSILDKMINGKDSEIAAHETIKTKMYEEQKDFVLFCINEPLNDNNKKEIFECLNSLTLVWLSQQNINSVNDAISTVHNRTYENIDECYNLLSQAKDEIDEMLKKANNFKVNMTESSVTIGDDLYDSTFDETLMKFDRSNRIPTGFKYLDDNVMIGGFERTRLYTFAGNSGSGKSTILANMCINAAKYDQYQGELKEKRKLFLYITLENDKSESMMRLFCNNFGIDQNKYLEFIKREDRRKEMTELLNRDLKNSNSIIKLSYFHADSITTSKISSEIDKFMEEYGGRAESILACVYIDYLDLIKNSGKASDHRFNLAKITQELKTLATECNVPVVTATQLNRESYKVTSAFDLSASHVAESIDKVNISDFVALMAKNQEDLNLVHFRIGKYRSGDPDVPLDFKVDFRKFSFIGCEKAKKKISKKSKNKSSDADSYISFEY